MNLMWYLQHMESIKYILHQTWKHYTLELDIIMKMNGTIQHTLTVIVK